MGTLLLVRHGQASFGADDYDRLSELGARQCARLGEYLSERGLAFDAVYTGTLRRHRESLAAVASMLSGLPEAIERPGLNEYDSHAVVRAVHPQPLPRPDTPELFRQHFRILRDGLAAWMDGRTQPEGMPTFADFRAGIAEVLQETLAHHGARVLVVSSGGPISTAIGHVLDIAPAAVIELNMRMRNSAVSELSFTPRRHALVTYNTLPHLDRPELAGWITHT